MPSLDSVISCDQQVPSWTEIEKGSPRHGARTAAYASGGDVTAHATAAVRTLPFTVDFASWPAMKRRHSPAAGNWMLPSHDAAMTRRRRRLVSSKCYCTRRLWRNPDQRRRPRDSALATGASIGALSAMAVPGNSLAPFVGVGWNRIVVKSRSLAASNQRV